MDNTSPSPSWYDPPPVYEIERVDKVGEVGMDYCSEIKCVADAQFEVTFLKPNGHTEKRLLCFSHAEDYGV